MSRLFVFNGGEANTAFLWSIGVTVLALLAFGPAKARFTGVPVLRGAVQTVVVGGAAAGVAYGLARLVSQFGA